MSEVLDAKALMKILTVSRATLYRNLETLPPRVMITKRRYGWLKEDIDAWLQTRKVARPAS